MSRLREALPGPLARRLPGAAAPQKAAPSREVPGTFGPKWGKPVGWVLSKGLWSVTRHGAEHVPAEGPVLLASNHLGFLDGPLLMGMAPRGTHFLVKKEMFRGWLGAVLRGCGQIPVDRTGDRGALVTAVQVLRRGGSVGVFPEGTRGRGDVASLQSGVTWLALQTGAPVVPVALLGTRPAGRSTSSLPRFRQHVHVVLGAPVHLTAPAGVPRRTALAQATEDLRVAMTEHVLAAVALTGMPLPDAGPGSAEEGREVAAEAAERADAERTTDDGAPGAGRSHP
ncbi:lysophospholipid acyltransferase family protein [Pseudokineococcus lusitanus]|uniref:1-acyl-sn-glycerol-3-phosphate acyltransferase n=1 Tax=Pseudokineococcus lusitanus TaxID=763993 RepID=A0A3N1HSW8_9ACTN|nr:lysophospholipid acyltransferase family protein [Pseudokineococcus lusitanus]ROP45615.1 1-acyl-sn-glycerol-3-phosphate acyltransferase [Pseudokineococcus lusitanus]